MAVEYGIDRTDDKHAMAIASFSAAALIASQLKLGRRVTNTFELLVESAPAALPATAKLRSGFALNADDCIYVTSTEPTTKSYSFGVATRSDGAVWITDTFTVPMREVYHPLLGFCIAGQTGALYVSGFAYAPLSDSGAGVVNTALTLGSGAATFVRTTEAATRLSTGLWKLDVASGVARSYYHEFAAGTMTYGGFLGEQGATQLALLPRDMTNAAWAKGATITVAQTGTGIDGVVNSCSRLTAGAVEATNTVLQTLVAAATSRTYSCWIKRVTGTGTITIQQNTTTLDVTALLNTTSFVQVALNASELNSAFGIKMATATDVILVDCNQFEAGANATTPIPAAGSRNADQLSYSGPANVSTSAGTCYAEVSRRDTGSGARSFVEGDGIAVTQPFLGLASADAVTEISIDDGAAGDVTKSGLTSLLTGVRKRASNWGGATMTITGDGAAVASGAFDGAMGVALRICPAVTTTSGGQCIKELKIWKTKRDDIATMTA